MKNNLLFLVLATAAMACAMGGSAFGAEPIMPDLQKISQGIGAKFSAKAKVRWEANVKGKPALFTRSAIWLEGVDFNEGTLEVDILGKSAPPGSNFPGLAFHGADDATFECVYFRPFNFRAENPLNASHAVQYISHPQCGFGKWHNGKSPGYLPADRGFQHVAIADLYIHQNNAYRISNAPKILADTIPYRDQTKPGDTADRLADDAIAFLRENQRRPFCLYLPHIAVHSPWEAPPALIAKYQKKDCSPRLAALCGLLEQMDTAIGRVLDELGTLGLAENTVVFFFSDNGAVHNTIGTHAGKLDASEIRARNVSRLRGTKGTIYRRRHPLAAHGALAGENQSGKD